MGGDRTFDCNPLNPGLGDVLLQLEQRFELLMERGMVLCGADEYRRRQKSPSLHWGKRGRVAMTNHADVAEWAVHEGKGDHGCGPALGLL